jgi:DNA-binding NarL/FixJ family response regulator
VIVRSGLRNLLCKEGFDIVAETSNGRDAVEQTALLDPDVAVLDISMPLLNGIDAAREIRVASPRTKVVFLTMHKQERFALEALRSGVDGYVVKTQATDDLAHARSATLTTSREGCPGQMRSNVAPTAAAA